MNRELLAKLIKAQALELGFEACGISKAEFLKEEAQHLDAWLSKSYHGTMAWMERHADLRLDPQRLVPGAKVVISVLHNYFPSIQQEDKYPKVARYAYGRDYHKVVKKKLLKLMAFIAEQVGAVEGRAFVDSAPVHEREWARRAGLGWIGKNSLLLTKGVGSYYFIGELILDLDLPPDGPVTDHCGQCTRCIDACPTGAIVQDKVVDATRCISYLTIELEEAIAEQFKGQMKGWAFGCDICQEVCPWNRFSTPHTEADFLPAPGALQLTPQDWDALTEEAFHDFFGRTPLKRAGLEKLKSSVRFGQEPI